MCEHGRAKLFLLLLTAGCGAGWRRVDPAPATLPPQQQVQVWRNGHARVFHAVRRTQDSLSGVPFQLPPDCDSCRVTLPLVGIDSLRVGNMERGAYKSIGVALLGLTALGAVLYLAVGAE
ncbi:MAG TPA: hypothetical protein VGN76_02315 [Gemmatimonadales bacterium]|jgi:hypothetical protein|nr:hypothetical protein [Gemmatimonadales bacterium]